MSASQDESVVKAMCKALFSNESASPQDVKRKRVMARKSRVLRDARPIYAKNKSIVDPSLVRDTVPTSPTRQQGRPQTMINNDYSGAVNEITFSEWLEEESSTIKNGTSEHEDTSARVIVKFHQVLCADDTAPEDGSLSELLLHFARRDRDVEDLLVSAYSIYSKIYPISEGMGLPSGLDFKTWALGFIKAFPGSETKPTFIFLRDLFSSEGFFVTEEPRGADILLPRSSPNYKMRTRS